MKEVHWHRLRVQSPEGQGHIDNIIVGLPLAEDSPGAEVESGASGRFQRVHPVLISVGGADLRIVPLAGVEVVVKLLHSRLPQPPGLVPIQKAQRTANADVHGLFYLSYGIG
jgi:hypothetical protein